MKTVTMRALVDARLCTGCGICAKVCPTQAITITNRKSVVSPDRCLACGNCNQRCPAYAVFLVDLDEPRRVATPIPQNARVRVDQLCRAAGFHPSQVLCYCTATRAEEVAAAILQGAWTPEEISFRTGLRTGCSVECIQPALRLLEAAGITPLPPPGGWQWYGKTPNLRDIPEEVKEKYGKRGFYFDEDLALFGDIAASTRR